MNKLLLIYLLLSSCALYGPAYKKPEVDIANKWSQDNNILINKESIAMSNLVWWGKFQDKQLNNLIESALANNANIQQAIGNIIQAQGNLKQVNLALAPTVSANGSYSATVNLNAGSSGNSGGTVIGTSLVPSGEWYSLGLIPLYSINLFQQLRMMDSAKAGLISSIYAKDMVRLTVISQVAGAYFTWLAQKEQLAINKELLLDLEQQLAIANIQYKSGYISLFNLQTIRGQYYNIKSQLPLIEKNIVASENTLKVLLNQSELKINSIKFTGLNVLNVIPTDIPSVVLKNRPDVLQAEANLMQANAGIGIATSNYFPTFKFNGGIGSSSPSSSGLFGTGRDFWQQQMQLTFPFLNLSYLGTIKGAKGVYYSAYYNYVMTVRQAYSDADNSITGYYKMTEYYKDIAQQLDEYIKMYHISETQYKSGFTSYYNLLTNKVNFDTTKLLYINSKLQQIQSIISFYQAMGGGYGVNNTVNIKKFADSHDID
jgi:multidrug efflux system outer membrane protein